MIPKPSSPAVFVDLAPLATDGSNGGAARFTLALAAGLLESGLELHLLAKPAVREALRSLSAAGARVHLLGEPGEVAEPRRLLRSRRRLPEALQGPLERLLPDRRSLRHLGAEVLLSPLGTGAFHEPFLPHVVVLHDLQELSHPGFFTHAELRRRRAYRGDLRRARRVIAISEASRREGIELLGLRPDEVAVVHPAGPGARERLDAASVAARLGSLGLTPGSYAFYLANFWPHKNHARLLAAVARTPLARDPGFRLVLCGALDEGRAAAAGAARTLGLSGCVTFLPPLPDADVTALFQGARFLVFPSLHEGFGIPVVEAFRLGTPVAASSLPALCEVAADGALLFDPEDEGAIGDAFARLWGDGELRRDLGARGALRAGAYPAEGVVPGYVAVLTEAARTASRR